MTATSDSLAIRPLAPGQSIHATIRVPGSKSVTNRALLIAALAEGDSTLENALVSDDSIHMVNSLRRLGFAIEQTNHDPATATFVVLGESGRIPSNKANLFVGNSGTTARFLTAAIGLGKGVYHIDGVARMRERPISPLIDALQPLFPTDPAGIGIESDDGKFPLTINAAGLYGGLTWLNASASSQFLSALLMVAPYAATPVQIELTGPLVSEPYIETTIRMMDQFGVVVTRPEPRVFHLPTGRYHGQRYAVEPDASNATYFFAAAAVTGGFVTVPYLTRGSLQGDLHFLDVLTRMGCALLRGPYTAPQSKLIRTTGWRWLLRSPVCVYQALSLPIRPAPIRPSRTFLNDSPGCIQRIRKVASLDRAAVRSTNRHIDDDRFDYRRANPIGRTDWLADHPFAVTIDA